MAGSMLPKPCSFDGLEIQSTQGLRDVFNRDNNRKETYSLLPSASFNKLLAGIILIGAMAIGTRIYCKNYGQCSTTLPENKSNHHFPLNSTAFGMIPYGKLKDSELPSVSRQVAEGGDNVTQGTCETTFGGTVVGRISENPATDVEARGDEHNINRESETSAANSPHCLNSKLSGCHRFFNFIRRNKCLQLGVGVTVATSLTLGWLVGLIYVTEPASRVHQPEVSNASCKAVLSDNQTTLFEGWNGTVRDLLTACYTPNSVKYEADWTTAVDEGFKNHTVDFMTKSKSEYGCTYPVKTSLDVCDRTFYLLRDAVDRGSDPAWLENTELVLRMIDTVGSKEKLGNLLVTDPEKFYAVAIEEAGKLCLFYDLEANSGEYENSTIAVQNKYNDACALVRDICPLVTNDQLGFLLENLGQPVTNILKGKVIC